MSPARTPNPAASPTAGQPSGMSPTAKRPRNVEMYASIDEGGGSRTMSNEDLTAGFLNLVCLQSRDAKFAADIAGCTHDNAGLLNAVISRTNAVEAAGKVAQGVIEQTATKL